MKLKKKVKKLPQGGKITDPREDGYYRPTSSDSNKIISLKTEAKLLSEKEAEALKNKQNEEKLKKSLQSFKKKNISPILTPEEQAESLRQQQNSNLYQDNSNSPYNPLFSPYITPNYGNQKDPSTFNAQQFVGRMNATDNAFNALGVVPKIPFNQTYKINPFANKLNNPNSFYRIAGSESLEDAFNTGVVRSRPSIANTQTSGINLGSRPTSFPSFDKGKVDFGYAAKNSDNVIYESQIPMFRAGEKNPVTGNVIGGRHWAYRPINTQTGEVITQIPLDQVNIYNSTPHWLKGYTEIPKKKFKNGGQIDMIEQYALGGLNRFDSPVQQAQGLTPFQLPYNELATALLSKQKVQDKKQEENLAYLDYASKLQSLPQDSPVKAEIINNIQNSVQSLQDTDLTSPEGKSKLNEVRGYIRKEFGPTGRATAIQSNYANYQDWLKRQQEAYKAKNINQDQLQRANDVYLGNYQGIGQIDLNTASYNQFKAPDVARYVDPTEFVDKYAKDFESSIRQSAYAKSGDDGYLYEGTDYTEVLTPQEIAEAMTNYINSNPEVTNYLSQGAELGMFDPNELQRGPFEYKTIKAKDGKGKIKDIVQLDFNERHPFGQALAGASSKYSKDIYKATRQMKDDSGYWKKKEVEDANKEDLIDAGTWVNNAFSKDVAQKGEGFFGKLFAGESPKYDQFNKEYTNKKAILSNLEAKRKSGVLDTGLENKIKNLKSEVAQMDNVNQELDKLYAENYKQNKEGQFVLKPYINPDWDSDTKARVEALWKQQTTTADRMSKSKFFDEHIQDISRNVTQYQRGLKIDNNSTDFEVNVGLTSQKGKKVYGNNGKQLDADLTVPTGYITKTSEGIMNLANAYFTNEDEAEKAGIEVIEMSGKEANDDIIKSQAAASTRGNTIPVSLFPEGTTVYKVKAYTEASSSTKNKYENLLYSKPEQELSNKINSNINAGLGGIVKVNDKITVGFDSNSDDSPYFIILTDGKETKTVRYANETEAVKKAELYKNALK